MAQSIYDMTSTSKYLRFAKNTIKTGLLVFVLFPTPEIAPPPLHSTLLLASYSLVSCVYNKSG